MKPPDAQPTRDELVAMAYADGELDGGARREFEERLSKEPALSRQVADYQALELLSRQLAPPEPADYEWARLEMDFLHRAGHPIGWILFTLGGVGLGIWGLVFVVRADIDPWPKNLLLAFIAGAVVLFLMTLRDRLAVLPYDPYRKVQR